MRLTHRQFANTLSEVFSAPVEAPLPDDPREGRFSNQADLLDTPQVLVEAYAKSAAAVAQRALARPELLAPCLMGATTIGKACLGELSDKLGLRAWRRPVEPEEREAHWALFQAASALGTSAALGTVLEAMILSPNFLFRTEVGDAKGGGRMTAYELASALSYGLTDGPPDAALLALAAEGRLADPSVWNAEVARLFASPRARLKVGSFFTEWLGLDDLEGLAKDPKLFPELTADVAKRAGQELGRLVEQLVFERKGSLTDVLTATEGVASQATGFLYGLDRARLSAMAGSVRLEPSQRAGLLTHPYFLAVHASADRTRAVDRGVFLRQEILCLPVPQPPDNVEFDAAALAPNLSERQRLAVHRKNAACAACHAAFDPLGLSLERYDAIGRFRTVDQGKTIDPSGTLLVPDEPDRPFGDFLQLASLLSATPRSTRCLTTRWVGFALGRSEGELSSCGLDALTETFTRGGRALGDLVNASFSASAFDARRDPTTEVTP